MKNAMERLKSIFTAEGKKGMVLALALAIMTIFIVGVVSMSIMVKRDANLIRRVNNSNDAKMLADAGIEHAIAKLKKDGFAARADFSSDFGGGAYVVTFSTHNGRHVVTSVGTILGVSATSLMEIKSNYSPALNYLTSAGDEIKIFAHAPDVIINGNLHANKEVKLRADESGALLAITGTVSAVEKVEEGSEHYDVDSKDTNVSINGVASDAAVAPDVVEGADEITFPVFDYESYKQAAQEDGLYYDSNTIFNSSTLSPVNGIVYVDGEATFNGTCTLNGGIIAEEIKIYGTLTQVKTGNRNVIIANEEDIKVHDTLIVEEALLYAKEDFKSHHDEEDDHGDDHDDDSDDHDHEGEHDSDQETTIQINGIIMAGEEIKMWDTTTHINYQYVYTIPVDLMADTGEDDFTIVSRS